jgi:hypothetical protein
MKIEVSEVIDRPVSEVFRFYGHEHVRNHPRWDPDMQLEQTSAGPIGVGTVIRRHVTRGGRTVEGTMEVVEFEPGETFATVIRDGPREVRGRATFEPDGPDRTTLTISADMPGMDESTDTTMITDLMRRSVENMKRLIEGDG